MGVVFPSNPREKGWCRFPGSSDDAKKLLEARGFRVVDKRPRGKHYRVSCRDRDLYVLADRHFAGVLTALGIPNHWRRGIRIEG